MKKNITFIGVFFILLSSLFVFTANGQEPAAPGLEAKQTVDAETEAISTASEPEEEDPGMKVENMINQYLNRGKGKDIREKIDKEGGWYGFGTAEVAVNPEDPNWAKFRVAAYEKALVNVENQYITTQNQTIKAEKLNSFFKNASDTVPDFQPDDMGDPGKVEILIEKLLAVAEGKLDQTLDELGIDKEQFNRVPKPQRHTLLSEGLSKSTVVESIGSLAGLIPIQTFEGYNAKKEHVIGVICIATANTKQFAYDILHSRGNLEPSSNKGKDLYELFSKDNNLLVDQFGIRKMKDEEGYPVLISFGQWSNSKQTDDQRLKRRYRDAAKKQAELSAKNQIALFLAGNSNFQSAGDIGTRFEEAYNVQHDNYKETDITNTIRDSIREKSRSQATATMSGLVQLYSWTNKHHQYGHEVVGVVMKWSPQDEKQARKLKDWRPDTNNTGVQKAPDQLEGDSGSKMGEEYMDRDDF